MSTPAAEAPVERRQIPGEVEPCQDCNAPIVLAITVAGPNGPGGKVMPLDHLEDTAYGNTAVRAGHGARPLARVLGRDEIHDAPVEYLAVPHFATCPLYHLRAARERAEAEALRNAPPARRRGGRRR